MVLKTLEILGPLARLRNREANRADCGDLLAVNQGTLYPVLRKLMQEGSIKAEWGASENNRKARFYRLTRRAAADCTPKPGLPQDQTAFPLSSASLP